MYILPAPTGPTPPVGGQESVKPKLPLLNKVISVSYATATGARALAPGTRSHPCVAQSYTLPTSLGVLGFIPTYSTHAQPGEPREL